MSPGAHDLHQSRSFKVFFETVSVSLKQERKLQPECYLSLILSDTFLKLQHTDTEM